LNRVKIYRLIVEYTSIPLLIGLYISFLTGVGLVDTESVKLLTFGLLDYLQSLSIHTNLWLNYIVGLLMVLHSASGLGLLIDRKIKSRLLKSILEVVVMMLVGVVLTIQFTFLFIL